MIAVLLYIIGLVAVVTTAVIVGFDGRSIYYGFWNAYNAGTQNIIPFISRVATAHSWALMPFLGGLLLMGFARIMMLLGAINRAVRHTG